MKARNTRRLFTRVLAGIAGPLCAPGLALAQTPTPAPDASATPSPALVETTKGRLLADQPIDILEDAVHLIEAEYVDGEVTREELVEAALRGIVDHLNLRSLKSGNRAANALLSRREMGRLTDSLSGEATGIGVRAQPVRDGIEVLQVFSQSPASKAGLQPGDRISAIDGYPITGLEAFALLRGTDTAPVRLQIIRPGAAPQATPIEVKIVRSRYRFSTVSAALLEGDVGYIGVGALTRGSADDVAGALLEFASAANAWAVVLDLRGNGGGSLHEATRLAEMFTKPGAALFQIETRGEKQVIASSGEQLWAGPLTVLVDSRTASATEALAAALQSNGAMLVGERTAGRGLGESIFPLPSGGALRLATARYRTAEGSSWIGRGLAPDSEVLAAPMEPDEPLDPQLRNALKILQKGHAQQLGPVPSR